MPINSWAIKFTEGGNSWKQIYVEKITHNGNSLKYNGLYQFPCKPHGRLISVKWPLIKERLFC